MDDFPFAYGLEWEREIDDHCAGSFPWKQDARCHGGGRLVTRDFQATG